MKLPTTSPIAPQWKTATNTTIAATVTTTFVMLAIAKAVERSSARNRFVSCW